MNHTLFLLAAILTLSLTAMLHAEWKPAAGPLLSRFAKDVTPETAHREYPRPQLVRKEWLCLNGLWDYSIALHSEPRPAKADGQILVPFPVESALSGVLRRVGESHRLWYRRTFEVPATWAGKRILLHFGAVDWHATVSVNGKEVGSHKGGYDPFSFDITEALTGSGQQELTVSVLDPTSSSTQPRGKQVNRPEGIWYTPTTGIWQTVWLEPVPQASIAALKIVPDLRSVRVTASVRGTGRKLAVLAEAFDGATSAAREDGSPDAAVRLDIGNPKLWSPDSPFLYGLKVTLYDEGKVVDEVESYFGLREISIGKDDTGATRILLNGKFVFQHGPLDQGFWPDGLYTAPTDEALRHDIEVTRELGFNMARKHVKVEPSRWYYWCDKLGLLVWQDMPSGDRYIRGNDPDIERTPESAATYERELRAIIDAFHNHPSIVMWVPFNEGWGQYDTERIAEWVKRHDPSRLVNSASGWVDRGVGDVHDIHAYPGPASPQPEEKRAAVLGEYGGLGLPLKGHTWQDEKNWGYRSFTSREDLTAAYGDLIASLWPLLGSPGLSAAVYTQTTDVEIEVNGLLTYDRALVKPDQKQISAWNRKLFLPPPRVEVVTPTSEKAGLEWHYTLEAPASGWEKAAFDAAGWKQGPGGFGTRGTPGAIVRTEWSTSGIWLRRTFEVAPGKAFKDLLLSLHHDEDAEVYLNGILAARATGFSSAYGHVPVRPEAVASLKPGPNLIAVHCRQTRGGQYVDCGLVSVTEVGN
jgi:hypothetical protein